MNFKSHQSLKFDFDKKFNCFVGQNGKGKTNVLDAIYFIGVTKSRFNTQDVQLIRHGESFFRLEANFENNLAIVVKYQKGKKVFELDEIPCANLRDFFGQIPIVMACPDDILLMIGGSEERRKFLDYTISMFDHDYFQHLIQYNHFLEQKNALLKMAGRQPVDLSLLELYNAKLVENGTPIFQKRKKHVDLLCSFINEFYASISNEKEYTIVKYESDIEENNFADLLGNNKEKEMMMQRCAVGIHRDDLLFLTDDYSTKKFASQGQQKTFLYSLRLAQYKMIYQQMNVKPILLIDDFFDKLDAERGSSFMHLLNDEVLFEQIFITDTDKIKLELNFSHKDYQIFELN